MNTKTRFRRFGFVMIMIALVVIVTTQNGAISTRVVGLVVAMSLAIVGITIAYRNRDRHT